MSYRRRIKPAEVLKRILDNSSDSEFDLSDSVDDSGDESRSQTPPPVPRTGAAGVTKVATGATDAFDWQPYDDLDCFYPEWLPEYKRRRSVLVDTSDYSPVHYFQLYFPDSVFDLMETEVNRFATQRLDTTADMPPSSRFHQWKDTDAVEMKAYVALNIAMGLCNKPSIADYWGTYWLTHTPFKQVMSRNRYQMLSSFLHFNDNENQVERGQPGYNPLYKIQTLLDIVDPLYESYYVPVKNLSIDESMVKFKDAYFSPVFAYKTNKVGPEGVRTM